MITGVRDEILRLDHTIAGCKESNPHKLDIEFMEKCSAALKVYRDLHAEPPHDPKQ